MNIKRGTRCKVEVDGEYVDCILDECATFGIKRYQDAADEVNEILKANHDSRYEVLYDCDIDWYVLSISSVYLQLGSCYRLPDAYVCSCSDCYSAPELLCVADAVYGVYVRELLEQGRY